MNRSELITAAQKAILEHLHNPAAPAVVQIWNDRPLPASFPIAFEYLGEQLNQSTQQKQHVYNLDAREVLRLCESR